MMRSLKSFLSSLLPRNVYRALLSPYHFLWAFFSALWFGFPARNLIVVGVTGTKGKSSVTEMIAAVLTAAGHKTAVSSTIRFSTGASSRPNLYKMTVPGRGFLQKFFADAVAERCTHAVVELTSEGALSHRHRFSFLNVLVFTNLQKEHIESHGGMEAYFLAKLEIGHELARSTKHPRAVIAENESEYGKRFLELPVEHAIPFSLEEAADQILTSTDVSFSYHGVRFSLPQPGAFTVRNALAAIKTGEFLGVAPNVARGALASLTRIPGRTERIRIGQDFEVIVDYAHTPDSLRALYEAYGQMQKICVLGNTGGGRDTWKRPEMGRTADEACTHVILTNEDPYDEDPQNIVQEMAGGMKRAPHIILDRREAIREAITLAQASSNKKDTVVLITGKGTDPYIMGPRDTKTAWSDAQVVAEELKKLVR